MPAYPVHALMEAAVQKRVKAMNVSVRLAGPAPPALSVRLHSICTHQVAKFYKS